MIVDFILGKDLSSATSRFRGVQVYDYFFEKNHKCNLYYPTKFFKYFDLKESDQISYFNFFSKIINGESNYVYFVRTIYDPFTLFLLMLIKIFTKKKIIFDTDDLIHKKKGKKLSSIFHYFFSNKIIVGSQYLKKVLLKYNKNILFIPTSVNFNYYKKKKIKLRKPIKLVWIGNGKNHYKNLLIIKKFIDLLLSDNFSFHLTFIGLNKNHESRKLFNDYSNKIVTLLKIMIGSLLTLLLKNFQIMILVYRLYFYLKNLLLEAYLNLLNIYLWVYQF